MTQIIDGKAFAARLREDIGRQVTELAAAHRLTPQLDVVLVGEDPASQVYVRNKAQQAAAAGIASKTHYLLDDVPQEELLEVLAALNADPEVNGILVQLPLPSHIDERTVLEAIDPIKDVDGFHPVNVGRLAAGADAPVPCTPLGCLLLLRAHAGELVGKRALVLGRSNIVGRPMAALLLREHCTVTIAHSRTLDLGAECRRAELLVVAVGRPRFVPGDWITPGATVIDVGINRIPTEDGKSRLVGDVDFESAAKVAGAITPVPGGVGPMTIACLLLNTLNACRRQHDMQIPS